MMRKLFFHGLLPLGLFLASGCVTPRSEQLSQIEIDCFFGETGRAEARCRDLLKRNPHDAEAECWMGRIESSRGNNEAALAHYRKCLALRPEDFRTWNRVGTIHFAQQQHDKAIEAFETGNRLQGNPESCLGLAMSYLEKGEIEKAHNLLLQAEQFEPGEETLFAIAAVYERMAHYDKALAILGRMDTPASKYRQGRILEQIGQIDAARSLLTGLWAEKVAAYEKDKLSVTAKRSLEDDLEILRLELGFLELRCGNREKAAEYLRGRPAFGFHMESMEDGRLCVKQVIPNSPAAAGGLKDRDIITRIGETVMTNGTAQFFTEVFPALKYGEQADFEVIRGGRAIELSIRAGITPAKNVSGGGGGADVSIALPPANHAPQNIAVAELDAIGISELEARTLTENLRSAMVDTGYFTVVSRNDMNRILEAAEFSRSDYASGEKRLVEMGRLLAVQKIAGGTIGKVGNTYSISLRMVDVETARIDVSVTEDVCSGADELLPAIRRTARRLAVKFSEISELE